MSESGKIISSEEVVLDELVMRMLDGSLEEWVVVDKGMNGGCCSEEDAEARIGRS